MKDAYLDLSYMMLHIVGNNYSTSNPLQCGFLNRKTVTDASGKKSKVNNSILEKINYSTATNHVRV